MAATTTTTTTSKTEPFSQGTVEILTVKPGFVPDEDDIGTLLYTPVRKSLFFDEQVTVYIVLHLPPSVETHAAESIGDHTSMTIEATVSDGSGRASAPPLQRQDSYSRGIRPETGSTVYTKALEAPIAHRVQRNKDHQAVIWTHKLTLPFTKTKSALSRVAISVMMTFDDYALASAKEQSDSYLEPSEFASRDRNYNLLRTLEHDPYLQHDPPRLSASRVSSVQSTANTTTRKARKSAKRFFPIISAIALRIRSFNISSNSQIILSIDLECSPNLSHPVELESVDLQLAMGKASPVCSFAFPIRVRKQDSFTLSYKLTFDQAILDRGGDVPATLTIRSTPFIHEDETIRGPKLISKWNTKIDLPVMAESPAPPQKPLPSPGMPAPPQKMQRSTSNLVTRQNSGLSQMGMSSTTNITITNNASSSTTNVLSGIVISIELPPVARVGQIIDVAVLVTNDSPGPKTLNLDVSRAPKKKKSLPRPPPGAEEHVSSPSPTPIPTSSTIPSSSSSGNGAGAGAGGTAGDLVLSHGELLALHARHTLDPTDFICLTPSIKVGHVSPEAQVPVTLRYLALDTGVFSLLDMRVVEVGTGQWHTLKDLPAVVVHSS